LGILRVPLPLTLLRYAGSIYVPSGDRHTRPCRADPADLHGVDQRFLAAIREIVSPLAAWFSDQYRALDRVASRIDTIAEDVAHLKQEMRYRRRNLRGATNRRQLVDIRAMGGRCPCCASAEVLDAAGQRSPFAEYDQFYASSHPDPEHT
jgi:hypothetical protein